MSNPLQILLHHSESVDPTLAQWIRERIDAITGVGPAAIVVAIGALIVVFPITLAWIARRRKTTE